MCCVFLRCTFKSNSTNDGDRSKEWNTLTVISEGSTIVKINNDNDSAFVNVFHRGSLFSPLPKKSEVKIDTIKTTFSKSEKDSLVLLAKEIISNPVIVKVSCTEYIGHLELIINYGAFEQKGEYSSVCDWTKVSDKTLKLHEILKRRIKGVYLGEGNQ